MGEVLTARLAEWRGSYGLYDVLVNGSVEHSRVELAVPPEYGDGWMLYVRRLPTGLIELGWELPAPSAD